MQMPQAQTPSFVRYADKAAFISGAVAASPVYKLGPQQLVDELAADDCIRGILQEVPTACARQEQHCVIDDLGEIHPETLTVVQRFLFLNGLDVQYRGKSLIIMWGQHAGKSEPPKTAHELLEVNCGVWAYWFSMAFSAPPEPQHASVPGGMRDYHEMLFEIIMSAAKLGKEHTEVSFDPPGEYFHPIAEDCLQLNGFQFEQVGPIVIRIQIRETDPKLPVP